MINLLGPPPSSLISQGELRDKFFSSEGKFLTTHGKPWHSNLLTLISSGKFLNQELLTASVPLEQRESTLEGTAEREAFLRFMDKMLQWEPSKRSSAKELAEDEWLHSHM